MTLTKTSRVGIQVGWFRDGDGDGDGETEAKRGKGELRRADPWQEKMEMAERVRVREWKMEMKANCT